MQCRGPVECAFRCSPPGIIVSGPLVREKLRKTYLLLGILYAGSAAAVVWAFVQGIGRVEIAVFGSARADLWPSIEQTPLQCGDRRHE